MTVVGTFSAKFHCADGSSDFMDNSIRNENGAINIREIKGLNSYCIACFYIYIYNLYGSRVSKNNPMDRSI